MAYRVARLHIFKPKLKKWVNFVGSCNDVGIYPSYRPLVFLWPFGIFFPVWVCCAKKNLATLVAWHSGHRSRPNNRRSGSGSCLGVRCLFYFLTLFVLTNKFAETAKKQHSMSSLNTSHPIDRTTASCLYLHLGRSWWTPAIGSSWKFPSFGRFRAKKMFRPY
jgi:hypothetical protein